MCGKFMIYSLITNERVNYIINIVIFILNADELLRVRAHTHTHTMFFLMFLLLSTVFLSTSGYFLWAVVFLLSLNGLLRGSTASCCPFWVSLGFCSSFGSVTE